MELIQKLSKIWSGINYPFLIYDNKKVNFSQIKELKFIDLSRVKQGDVVAFDGTKLKHGVSEVTKGNRYSLSIWLKESKTDLIKFKKTII